MHVDCSGLLRLKSAVGDGSVFRWAAAGYSLHRRFQAVAGPGRRREAARRCSWSQLSDCRSLRARGAIPKVNSSDLAQLALYGFTTAVDAKHRDVRQVHGIGPLKASNIAAWTQRVEAKFQFHSAYTPEDQRNIQKAQNEIVTRQQGLEERVKKAIVEFRQEAQAFERWKATRDPELVRLAQQLAQAEADLKHIGSPVPSQPNVAPTLIRQVSTSQRTTRPANFGMTFGGGTPTASPSAQPHAINCPRCGSRMVRRTARRGARVGKTFWGCSRYPTCTGTRPI
jgi:ssDNA-binding Zn-finger/Zn-ribbon topoisomerase 1